MFSGNHPSRQKFSRRRFLCKGVGLPGILFTPQPGFEPALLLLQPDLFVSGLIAGEEGLLESGEGAFKDSVADFLHKVDDEAEVMDGGQAVGQELLAPEKVMKVGGGKGAAGVAIAALFNGARLLPKAGVGDVAPPQGGEEAAVAGNPGGEGAIEEVNAAGHAVDQVLG